MGPIEMDLEILKNLIPGAVTEVYLDKGMPVARVDPAHLHGILKHCKEDPRLNFNFLMDIVAVDFLGEIPRFEVVYVLYSLQHNRRLLLKVRVEHGESLPSAVDIYQSADWAEREIFDMMGVGFRDHPNLKRILLFEGFEGHPLRKDYPVNRRQRIPEIEEVP